MNTHDAKRLASQANVGYWQVLDECYFSKTEALRAASRIGVTIRYWYFDEVFRAQRKEPIGSLDSVYDDRARAIREKYDYVAIAVSGGADSTNLLQAFLRCGLQVDEVITYYPVKVIDKLIDEFDGSTAPQNLIFEYEFAFKPLAKRLQELSPGTKITVIDHSTDALNTVVSGTLNKSFHDISRTPNFVGVLKLVQYLTAAEHQNACIVVGSDKPVILYDTLHHQCFAVFDDFTNALNLANISGAVQLEPFYFTKDAPSILHKQYMAVKRAFDLHLKTGTIDDVVSKRSTDARFKLLDMKHPIFERAIYPSLWPISFQADKPMFTLFNESGSWLFHDRFKHESKVNLIHSWKGQINEFVSGIDEHFIEYKNGLPVKFKPCQSAWFTFK